MQRRYVYFWTIVFILTFTCWCYKRNGIEWWYSGAYTSLRPDFKHTSYIEYYNKVFYRAKGYDHMNIINITRHNFSADLLNTTEQNTSRFMKMQYLGSSNQVSLDDSVYRHRRLGNQMFSIAGLLYISALTGREPVLKRSLPRLYAEDVFQLQIKRADIQSPHYTLTEKQGLAFDLDLNNQIIKAGNRTILDTGYRQSWKYAQPIEEIVRSQLTFPNNIKNYIQSFLSYNVPLGWKNLNFTRVGIHVRRSGISTKSALFGGYTVPSERYFEKAMTYFVERYSRVQFIVSSDDLRWTKSNIVHRNVSSLSRVNVTYSVGHSSGIDMAILAMCDHVIMSTGTFGWWAAWLANGITIYYEDWPRKNSLLYSKFKREDFFPSTWIQMNSL